MMISKHVVVVCIFSATMMAGCGQAPQTPAEPPPAAVNHSPALPQDLPARTETPPPAAGSQAWFAEKFELAAPNIVMVPDLKLGEADESLEPGLAVSMPKRDGNAIPARSGEDFYALGSYATNVARPLGVTVDGNECPVRYFRRGDLEEVAGYTYRVGWIVRVPAGQFNDGSEFTIRASEKIGLGLRLSVQ
jgi:hypothetical protein